MKSTNLVSSIMSQGCYSLTSESTITDAAIFMRKKGISALGVTQGDDVVGIFSERDVVHRIVARKVDPSEGLLGEFMSSPIVTVKDTDPLDKALYTMKTKKFRHLIIVDDHGKPVGMLSIRDVFKHFVDEDVKDLISDLKKELD